MINILLKKYLSFLLLTFISFNHIFSSEPEKQKTREKNLDSYLSESIPNKDIQNIIAQYLNKWDEIKRYDAYTPEKYLNISYIIKSPNGKLLCSVNNSTSNITKLWDITNMNNIKQTASIPTKHIISIDIDSKYLCISDSDDLLAIHDINDLKKLACANIGDKPCSLKINNNFIFIHCLSSIRIFNISNLENICLHKIYQPKDFVNEKGDVFIWKIFFSDNCNFIAISYISNPDKIKCYNCKNLDELKECFSISGGYNLSFSPNNKYIALTDTSGDDQRKLQIYSIEHDNKNTLIYKYFIEAYNSFVDVKFSPNGKYLACTEYIARNHKCLARVFDLNNLEKINFYNIDFIIEQSPVQIYACPIAFSNDNSAIIIGGYDGKLAVITNTGELLQNINAADCRYCQFCNKIKDEAIKLYLCGSCRKVRYCNRECQAKDWVNHKASCKRDQ